MDWNDIWILYRRELRCALRERAIVVNSILMPLFLYPVMLWVMFTGIVFVTGLAERTHSRLVILDAPSAHPALMDTLRARTSLEIREDVVSPDSAAELIRVGELDALVEFLPPEAEARGMDDNFRVLIRYDRAVERSRRARDRVRSIVAGYRRRWVEREASALDISDVDQEQFRIVQDNVSSGRQMGALIMGMLIPLFLVLMVALGCLIPAIDSTAGERERSTWETLMPVSASRWRLMRCEPTILTRSSAGRGRHPRIRVLGLSTYWSASRLMKGLK